MKFVKHCVLVHSSGATAVFLSKLSHGALGCSQAGISNEVDHTAEATQLLPGEDFLTCTAGHLDTAEHARSHTQTTRTVYTRSLSWH